MARRYLLSELTLALLGLLLLLLLMLVHKLLLMLVQSHLLRGHGAVTLWLTRGTRGAIDHSLRQSGRASHSEIGIEARWYAHLVGEHGSGGRAT